MTRPRKGAHLSLFFPLVLLTAALNPAPAQALDLGYACRADADRVFVLVHETVRDMTRWRAVRVDARERTIKAVLRGWRNIALPVWIQVREAQPDVSGAQSELHVMWEQAMEPLNYPDLISFTERFEERQRTLGLDCADLGTDIGL